MTIRQQPNFERNTMLESLSGQSILEISDYSPEQIKAILEQTSDYKNSKVLGSNHQGKLFAMLFTNNSTRTRISMLKSAALLGIVPIELDSKTSQISRGEPIADTCGVFDQMIDGLAIRTSDHNVIEQFRDTSQSTVVYNALSDWEHPLQAIADLQTIKERFGSFEGLKVAYSGENNNVSRSLMLGCLAQEIDFSIACPNPNSIDQPTKLKAQRLALENNCTVTFTDSAREAVQNANVVYTDVWFSMGQSQDEKEAKMKTYQPYQVNQELINVASRDAIAMHCMPMHRGEEITAEVANNYNDTIMRQAGNRLHTFRTILDYTLRKY